MLVVEDERLIARELQVRLEELGHTVSSISDNAEDAIRSAEQDRPDIALMDIRIQGARDGIEAAAILQERFDLPVVFLTAHSDQSTLDRAKAVCPAGYLLKPLSPRELVVTLEVGMHNHAEARRRRDAEHERSAAWKHEGPREPSSEAAAPPGSLQALAARVVGDLSRPVAAIAVTLDRISRMLDTGRSPTSDELQSLALEATAARALAIRIKPILADLSRDGPPSARRPRVPRSGSAAASLAPPGQETTARARIMAVDDDEIIRRLFAQLLRDHDVVTTDGVGAVRLLQAGERFDLVLSDIEMSLMSGADLYDSVQTIDAAQAKRFAFVTSGALSPENEAFLSKTTRPVLKKPFTASGLSDFVQAQIHRLGRRE